MKKMTRMMCHKAKDRMTKIKNPAMVQGHNSKVKLRKVKSVVVNLRKNKKTHKNDRRCITYWIEK